MIFFWLKHSQVSGGPVTYRSFASHSVMPTVKSSTRPLDAVKFALPKIISNDPRLLYLLNHYSIHQSLDVPARSPHCGEITAIHLIAQDER